MLPVERTPGMSEIDPNLADLTAKLLAAPQVDDGWRTCVCCPNCGVVLAWASKEAIEATRHLPYGPLRPFDAAEYHIKVCPAYVAAARGEDTE